ncbi:MAG TPA: hypothetical protein VMO26_15005 [Vicinamibacterales bacterium]|nr:hypothetical protein [Vicinamibacterales bacterium]
MRTAKRPAVWACCVWLCGASPVAAQTSSRILPANLLRDLPNGGNVFAVVETTEPEIVTDRFNSGGLNGGTPSRVGGLFSSWTQTRHRIGDVDVASAVDGTPLIFPRIAWWDSVAVSTTMTSPELDAPELTLSLRPRTGTARWTGDVEAVASRRPLIGSSPAHPPPIARLDAWTTASGVVSGPLTQRLKLAFGGAWSRSAVSERASAGRVNESTAAFAHITRAMSPTDTWSGLAIAERSTRESALHVQSTWARAPDAGLQWRVYGGYTHSNRVPLPLQVDVIERLTHGPVPAVVAHRARLERLWTAGVRLRSRPRGSRHGFAAGGDVSRAGVTEPPMDAHDVHETVDGRPARIWAYGRLRTGSRRVATTLSGHVDYHLSLTTRATLAAGARYEQVRGRAALGTSGISWNSVLPAARLTWELGTPLNLTLMTGVRRTANRLMLELLTVGDPASPAADVYRWDALTDARGPLVARVGPGTGGDARLSALDPDLHRSTIDEFAIGLSAKPRAGLTLAVSGVARQQSNLVGLVNAGLSPGAFREFTIRDDNADLVKPDDDQDLPVYDRLPSSFAQDRYLLTNHDDHASMGAVVLSAEASTPRLYLFIGATASAAVGPGASRGFRAIENDQDALGERTINPNAGTHVRGRLFADRAYTVKWTTVYRFPRDVRLGVIARYQDGQPFTRMVVVPDLNQGAEVIQAFPRGRSRFAFTGTLDVRLQKEIKLGHARLGLILDVYNVPGMRKETEEYVVTGPRFRESTAVQPPRAAHLGLRLSF